MNEEYDEYRRSPSGAESAAAEQPAPQFGLVDVIEAFTAMRHEWRGQSREGRDLAAGMQAAVERIEELHESLAEAVRAIGSPTEAEMAARLAETLAEIDWHLTRAAEAAMSYSTESGPSPLAEARARVEALYGQLRFPARWFCRPFHQAVLAECDRLEAERRDQAQPIREGLKLLVARVERLLRDRQVERVDTLGSPFDAELMNAIEAVETDSQASGHVIEQLSPAYFWRGRLIRYAEVRVAR